MGPRKGIILLAAACAALLLLQGCLSPPFTVTATPERGYPNDVDGGLLVRFAVSVEQGKRLTVNFGDGGGTAIIYQSNFRYTYTRAGTFEWIVSCGEVGTRGTVQVLDEPPVVYPPAWTQGNTVECGEGVTFNANHHIGGCEADTGAPLSEYGAYDPNNGDRIEIRYNCHRKLTGEQESIFDADYNIVNGQWIPMQLVKWFAGYRGLWPLFPFILPLGCNPWPGPGPAPAGWDAYEVVFALEARDQWGMAASTSWTVTVHGCGTSGL